MITIVLPGLSPTNKTWLDEAGKELKPFYKLYLHHWSTWSNQNKFDFEYETNRILKKIKSHQEVNFIAKSIGTKVLMKLVPNLNKRIRKVILCGIPIDPLNYYSFVRKSNGKDLLIIQNSKDPYLPYKFVKPYIYLINKEIKVIQKESNTHDYPYYDIFNDWLSK